VHPGGSTVFSRRSDLTGDFSARDSQELSGLLHHRLMTRQSRAQVKARSQNQCIGLANRLR
jgi:hypothetical protein